MNASAEDDFYARFVDMAGNPCTSLKIPRHNADEDRMRNTLSYLLSAISFAQAGAELDLGRCAQLIRNTLKEPQ
jgi:hypothetical protein